jgi:pimeloyl-ACP methyl ester carboxylesterase
MRCLLAAMVSLWLVVPAWAQTAAGLWEGAIATSSAPLRVAVRLEQATEGGPWSGTIDIPSQGIKNARLSEVRVDLSTIRFVVGTAPNAPTFVGALSPDGSEIAGRFTQAKVQLAFTLTRNTSGVVIRQPRPQEPRAPLPYDAEDLTFRNASADVGLAGTITLPRATGRHPAVVLVSGGGAQDRDATINDHKPFLVIADHLTRQGIVVLRVDDRGVGGSTGTIATATSDDLVADVLAAVEALKRRPDVDPARIGLLSHGEGGIITAIAATRTADVRFLVLLSAPGVSGDQVMEQQVTAIARAMKLDEAIIAKSRARQQELSNIVRTETDPEVMRTRIRAVGGDAAVRLLMTPWFRFFLTHDPAAVLRTLTVPTLAIGGDHDLQVPGADNVPVIAAALKAAGNTDVTTRVFPRLNHLLQTSRTGLPLEYGTLDETVAPDVLTAISDWILRRAPQ